MSGSRWVFMCLIKLSVVHIHVSRSDKIIEMLLAERLPFVVIIRPNRRVKFGESLEDARQDHRVKEFLTATASDSEFVFSIGHISDISLSSTCYGGS